MTDRVLVKLGEVQFEGELDELSEDQDLATVRGDGWEWHGPLEMVGAVESEPEDDWALVRTWGSKGVKFWQNVGPYWSPIGEPGTGEEWEDLRQQPHRVYVPLTREGLDDELDDDILDG